MCSIGECIDPFGCLTLECDVGLDGIANTNDFGEGDGIWQPGDGWIDANGDGLPFCDYLGDSADYYVYPDCENFTDVWPPANGYYDEGEDYIDENGNGFYDGNNVGYQDTSDCINIGDLNGDLEINVSDIIILVNLILDDDYNEYGDIDLSGELNIFDIIQLINIILDD